MCGGPKGLDLVRGRVKHFEPIGRSFAVHDTVKCGHIWIECGTRAVLALREAAAIGKER